MGVVDYGNDTAKLNAPKLSLWAAAIAAVLDNSDVSVDTRIANFLSAHPGSITLAVGESVPGGTPANTLVARY